MKKLGNYLTDFEATDFLGLCKVLCVSLTDEDGTSRSFDELLTDLLTRFETLNRAQKHQVLRLARDVAKTNRREHMRPNGSNGTKTQT